MSKNNNRYNDKMAKKAGKLSRKIDDRALNEALSSKEMADPVKTISEHTHGKRFKFKGLDGTTKKMLKTGCVHGFYTKKGKIKPAIIPNNDGTATCPICGRTFPLVAPTDGDYVQAVDAARIAHDQVGLIITVAKLGKPVYRYHNAMMNRTKRWEKINRKILKLGSKNATVGNGKKHGKNKNHGGGSNDGGIAGGWY